MKRLDKCNFAKAILMVLVIIDHSCSFYTGNWFLQNPVFESNFCKIICTWLSSFHVYTFTFISGYIFGYKYITLGEYKDLFLFIKNKAQRLLLPYSFTSLFWVIPISEYFFQWDLSVIFRKYILCIDPSQFWFLWMLFDVFVIIYLLKNLFVSNFALGCGISILFYITGTICKRIIPNVFCIWTAFQYIPFFFVGIQLYKYENISGTNNKLDKVKWFVWVILDVVILVSEFLFFKKQNALFWKLTSNAIIFLSHIVGVMMAWVCIHDFAEKIDWKNNLFIQKLTTLSFPMYLFHQQIIYFTIVLLNGKINPLLNSAVNFIAAVIGSYLISVLLTQWKFTRFMICGK